jgi:Helix-hairpin-helix motif
MDVPASGNATIDAVQIRRGARTALFVVLVAALIAGLYFRYQQDPTSEITLTNWQPSGRIVHTGFLPDGRIDLNRASPELLASLPGIGEVRARAIVDARATGEFASLEEVSARAEIPPSSLDQLTELAGVE